MQSLSSPVKALSVVFMGYSDNGQAVLRTLVKNNFKPKLVVYPKNKSHNVYNEAVSHNIPTIEYSNQSVTKALKIIRRVKPDCICIASFPYLVPLEIINLPRFGTLNVHGSALPSYRGVHPLNWAIIKDEPYIGVTIHYVDQGMDSGDILIQDLIKITHADDINSLKQKSIKKGAQLLIKVLKKIEKSQSKLLGNSQNHASATFAPKRTPADGKVNWSSSTREIFNLVRALKDPYPNAFTFSNNSHPIQIKSTYLPKEPGLVLGKIHNHYIVSTGDGIIAVKTSKTLTIGTKLG